MATEHRISLAASLARQGATNLVIQLLTLISKSLLIFILARFLPVEEVGIFGLLLVTLSLGVHVLGLDFYAFSTRELVAAPVERVPALLRDQLLLHLLCYPAALLIGTIPFLGGTLPWELLGLFLALLLLEHFGQEIQRALVALQRPVQGAVVLLLRAGAWIWVVAALLLLEGSVADLIAVVWTWIGGTVAGIVLGLWFLRDLPWGRLGERQVDWAWIRGGLRISLPFLLASFSHRGILSVDRYALQHFAGAESVGIYSLYANFRNAILSFSEMGILFVYRPPIIAAWQSGEPSSYRSLLRQMGRLLFLLPVALSAAAAIVIVPLLDFVGEPAYRSHLHLLWILLLSAVIASLAEIPHTALYARGMDRAIIVSTVFSLAVAVALNLLLVPPLGPYGAGLATLASFSVLAVTKGWYALRAS